MLTYVDHARLRDKIDRYYAAQERLFPGRNGFTPMDIEMVLASAGIDAAPTNEERSAVEVYEFMRDKPVKYFAYVNTNERQPGLGQVTTWTGDLLGACSFGREYRDKFGGKRVPITVHGINGLTYHGTYFKSAGDYCRLKASVKR